MSDKRRIGTVKKLKKEVKAWSIKTNKKQRGVDWQMKIDDARIKLKSVYPKIIAWQTTTLLSVKSAGLISKIQKDRVS